VLLVARILGGGDERQWLLFGLVAGIGLENKHLVLLLLASLAAGCLLDRRFGLACSPWLWAGSALALVLWLPNLLWQSRHGWPQLELAGQIGSEDPIGNRIALLPLQLLLIGPLLAPLWLAGFSWLLRRPEARPYRPLALAYLVLLGVLFLTGAKPYYTMGLLLSLLGAGGVVAEHRLATRPHARRRLGIAIAATAVLAAAVALPLVPVGDVHATPIPVVNEDAVETIGWPRFAATVAGVVDRLPPARRAHAVVFTGNYGEAGAIARYGPALGLPAVYSGHNAFWRFARPPDGAAPVIVLGHSAAGLRGSFTGCVLSAQIDDGVEVDNEEQGGAVWTCSGTARPWSELWPQLRHLDA